MDEFLDADLHASTSGRTLVLGSGVVPSVEPHLPRSAARVHQGRDCFESGARRVALLWVSNATALGHVRACFVSWTPSVALLWVGDASGDAALGQGRVEWPCFGSAPRLLWVMYAPALGHGRLVWPCFGLATPPVTLLWVRGASNGPAFGQRHIAPARAKVLSHISFIHLAFCTDSSWLEG